MRGTAVYVCMAHYGYKCMNMRAEDYENYRLQPSIYFNSLFASVNSYKSLML